MSSLLALGGRVTYRYSVSAFGAAECEARRPENLAKCPSRSETRAFSMLMTLLGTLISSAGGSCSMGPG